ncbi:hypothetical protein PMAYCL1PPCAC_14222, partial [Pristionchus mayeri]
DDWNISDIFLKVLKEEPLEMELKEEPIDEPLSDGNQQLALDFIEDEMKKEEMEPKEELVDAPLSAVDQQIGLVFIDEFKDEPILNEDHDNGVSDLDPMGDMIDH